ncbi:MAG: FAD-binding oxidoreductase [Mycobacteriaceae bacterium]|nr:FAD-binding oxidoreductase [Mycobacteriaceae bacterium]
MPCSADIVVVGAGIVGASITHHLARRGVSVTVLDQAIQPGAGATRFSGGLVRAYDPDAGTQELALASLAVYRDAAQWNSGYAPLCTVGAVTVAHPVEESTLRDAARVINAALNTSAQVVTNCDAALGVGLAGGIALVEPEAGWVSATSVTSDWLRQAKTNGAVTRYGIRVQRIDNRGGRPVVVTPAGEIHAGAVVVSAGPWAARPIAGLRPQHRVRARSIQVSIVHRPSDSAHHATFIDQRTGVYGKPIDAHHSLIGMPHLVWDAPFDRTPDQAHVRATARAVSVHLPWAWTAKLQNVIRAADGYSEHSEFLTGTNVPHVWVVRGWNGGGVRTAPEAGRRIAELCLTRTFETSA